MLNKRLARGPLEPALAVGPELEYSVVAVDGRHLVVGTESLERYAPELGAPWRTKSLYFATLPKATVETLRPYLFEDSKIIIAGTAPDLVDVTLDLQARLGDKVRAINAHKTEVARSASMQNFMRLPRDMQRLFLGWESYRRRDLVPGGCDLA